MSEMILCPICEEELASTVESLPEKCPICDTRKFEIIQEMQDDSDSGGVVSLPGDPEPAVEENMQSEVVVEEEAFIPQDSVDNFSFNEEEDNIIFSDGDEETEDVIFDDPGAFEAEVEEQQESKIEAPAQSTNVPPVPEKSGASTLETFPIGFKYCPACQAGFAKNFDSDKCSECNSEGLKSEEKGFIPGHYLTLYSDKRKTMAYFRLDNVGSIIIGRTSERNSSQDIDLTMAWRKYYKENCPTPEKFKEKMALVKGISRKHALIRYMPAEKKYVLFHLSDKNFTVVQLPGGEKRTRPPQNRTRVDLVPGAIVTMGNQKNFIILSYRIITPPKSE